MFAEVIKSRLLLIAATVPPLLVILFFAVNGWNRHSTVGVSSNQSSAPISVAQMNESLARDRKLLADYEKEQSALRTLVVARRKQYQDGQTSKAQVVEAETSFVGALRRVHEMRNSVTETQIAITEAVLGEKVLRMPDLPVGGFSQTAELLRFNGGFKWSVREAPRIQRFFSQTFNRSLPVTALGQSDTHTRLGFDHRDSLDVGLHPDSTEGKSLIEYLRKSGIPFLAFRQTVPGAATGPHIHIGKPSHRLAN
jgi:hypothetical protein